MISQDLTLSDLIAGGARLLPVLGGDGQWYVGVYCFNIAHVVGSQSFTTFEMCRAIAQQMTLVVNRQVAEQAVEFYISYRQNGGAIRNKAVLCLPSDSDLWRNTIELDNGYKANRAHLGMIGHVKDEIIAVEGKSRFQAKEG